jgi:hypothetical protein
VPIAELIGVEAAVVLRSHRPEVVEVLGPASLLCRVLILVIAGVGLVRVFSVPQVDS